MLHNYPLQMTALKGSLNLYRAQISGDIVLNGAKIHGRLKVNNVHAGAQIRCRPVDLGLSRQPVRASASQADFSALEIAGDVSLTGLDLIGETGEDKTAPERLVLRDARIRGSLELFRPAWKRNIASGEYGSAETTGLAGGRLQMEAVEVGHVILSGHSFDPQEPNTGLDSEAPVSIAFDRAKIARLEIVDPLPAADLSDMTVGSWEEPPGQGFFPKMLALSRPFRRSNYIAIENDLRNKGRDEDADAILIAMRRRDRTTTRNFRNTLPDRFFDITTKYGTTSGRLVGLMAAMLVCSFLIFRDPAHVEYKIAPVAPMAQPAPMEVQRAALRAIVHPEGAEWKVSDTIFLLTRLHVPILSLGIGDDVQPSGIWPKAYAAIVQALSWIMWPLFLASASGFLRKQR